MHQPTSSGADVVSRVTRATYFDIQLVLVLSARTHRTDAISPLNADHWFIRVGCCSNNYESPNYDCLCRD
jgi:hypothetical protein